MITTSLPTRNAATHPLLRMDLGLIDLDRLPSIYSQMRFHTWADIASIVTIAAGAASIGTTAYSAAQGSPKAPNLASSSRAVARAQAGALPYQRGLSAAEQQGGSALRLGYSQSTYTADQRQALADRIARLQTRADGMHTTGFAGQTNKADILRQIEHLQGQLNNIPEGGGQVYLNRNGKPVPQSEAIADFKGYGTADVEGELSRQMADVNERLGAKYGTQYAEEARHEAELADPQGFAARDKELELIQKGIDNPLPINPMATTLDQHMKARLEAGSGLDDMSRQVLDAAIARSNADRGGGGATSGDVAGEMSTGAEGAVRRQAGISAGQAWLASGATPEDVEYRREQQNLGNLASFMNGQTPQSQFQNLSGASQGAAPFYPGQGGPTMPGGAAAAGSNYGVSGYLANLRNMQGQANPWMAGLSSILSGLGGFAGAGKGGGGEGANSAGGNQFLGWN